MHKPALDAMRFAIEKHGDQRRKYTNDFYWKHLAEVAGIVASAGWIFGEVHPETAISVAWLHDSVEDAGVTIDEIESRFGFTVAVGVSGLTDVETGNRKQRKEAARQRLAFCSGWIQTIKCADLISNTSSIVQHDPQFAKVYLEEKRLLLEVLTKADGGLLAMAKEMVR